MTAPIPALEIGGSHVVAALVDPARGAVLPGSRRSGPLDGAGSAEEICAAVLGCAAELPAPPSGGRWGVAIPGPFDYRRGVALFRGVGKFDACYGLDLRRVLLDGLPGRAAEVSFLNDADAFLLGEACYGAAVGHDRCVALTLGTGIGSAFLSGGELRAEGPGVPPEARIDLIEIDGRPLEETVSSRAIRRAYAAAQGSPLRPGAPEVAEIARRARAGDPLASAVLHTALHALGCAVAPWLSEFGATAVVVGGSMTGSWDLVGPALRSGLGRGVPPGALRLAAHPEDAALLGAARHSRDGYGEAC